MQNLFCNIFTTFRNNLLLLRIIINLQDMYGERIKYFREQKGISQAAMAEKLHMAQATYSKIETNRTRLATDILERINR